MIARSVDRNRLSGRNEIDSTFSAGYKRDRDKQKQQRVPRHGDQFRFAHRLPSFYPYTLSVARVRFKNKTENASSMKKISIERPRRSRSDTN